jgi:hypothetical protein
MLQGCEGEAAALVETAAGAHGTVAHVFIGRGGKGRVQHWRERGKRLAIDGHQGGA